MDCKNCGYPIPTRIPTEKGWEIVSPGRVYCFTCSPKGRHNTRVLHLEGIMPTCSRCGNPVKPRKGQHSITVTTCPSCQVTLWRRRMKQRAVAYKGGKCCVCGYTKSIAALDFHHLDPNTKDFTFSGKTVAWARMQEELDKSILLCANCHRAFHAGDLALPPDIYQSETPTS